MESRVNRELSKVTRTNQFQAHNQVQSHHRLVELLRNLHLLVIDAIDTDLSNTFGPDHIRYIKTVINDEIEALQKKIDQVGELMKKLPFQKKVVGKNDSLKLKDFKITITNQNQGSRERNQPFSTQTLDPNLYKQINTSSSKGSIPQGNEGSKRQRSGSSVRNRPGSAHAKQISRPIGTTMGKTGGFKGSFTRPSSHLSSKAAIPAPRYDKRSGLTTRAPIHHAAGSTTQRSSVSNQLRSSQNRSKSKDKRVVSRTKKVQS